MTATIATHLPFYVYWNLDIYLVIFISCTIFIAGSIYLWKLFFSKKPKAKITKIDKKVKVK